jgi:hypothetical protein
MLFLLETVSGSQAGHKTHLQTGTPFSVGRTKGNHLFPDDSGMSGSHFVLETTLKGCRLRDLHSSNGTFLNGARVKEATLANGDEIRAGNTVFVIRMLPDEPLPAAPAKSEQRPEPTPESRRASPAATPAPRAPVPTLPAPAPGLYGGLPSFPAAAPKIVTDPAPSHARPLPPAPVPRQPRLQELLAKDFQPLYALLDASREPSVLKVILESKEEHQSLYEGPQGAQLAHFAPYLIRVPQQSPLLDTLVHQGWSKNWGVFLTCDKPLKDLRIHFRHFLIVKLPDGTQVYFRYYDPRVLRLFLPTCFPEESTQFFGPVKQFLIEAEDPKLALHFTRGPKGPDKKELHLVTD